MLSHRTSLRKFKKTEINQIFFSNHDGIKLEINQNIYTYVETKKQYTSEQLMAQRIIQNGNQEAIENRNIYNKTYGMQQKQC